jgi:hypothetical protein
MLVKVYVLPADAYGCGFYRLIWPAVVLQSQGHDVEIMAPSKTSGFRAATTLNNDGEEVLTSVEIPQDADAVVVQRPAHPLQPQMINILRSNGIAVIVDMDDDMSCIHPENSAFHMYRHRSSTAFSWRYAGLSCRIASMVTVSTPQLAKVYGGHGRVRVLDNYVPAEAVGTPHLPTGAFGWAGTTKSHPNDPQVTGHMAQKLISEGYTFQVVGGDPLVKNAFRMQFPPLMTGSVKFADWIPTLATAMDVGWAPLASTAFNSSKSRLKPLEYMAAGVTWVGSPRAEYRKLHREAGCGFLAETPKQWYNWTKTLLGNESLRQEQVEAGYAYLQDQTYEANAWRWAEAWTDAITAERKRVGLNL